MLGLALTLSILAGPSGALAGAPERVVTCSNELAVTEAVDGELAEAVAAGHLDPAEIAKLADLESREVLLGKLAGAMLASLSQAVYLLNAPLSQAARLAGALQAKAEQDPSILSGGAGEPAAAAEKTAEAPVTDEAPASEAASEAPADEAAAETTEES